MAVFLLSTAVSGAYYDPPGWTTGHTEYEVIWLDVEGPSNIASLKGLAIYREEFLAGLLHREGPLEALRGDWVWAVAAGDPNPGLDPALRPTGRVWFVYEASGHVWTVGEFRFRPDAAASGSGGPRVDEGRLESETGEEAAPGAPGAAPRNANVPLPGRGAPTAAPPPDPQHYAYGVAVGPVHASAERGSEDPEPRSLLANLLGDLGNGGARAGESGAYNFFLNADLARLGLLADDDPQLDLYVDEAPESWRQPKIPPSPYATL